MVRTRSGLKSVQKVMVNTGGWRWFMILDIGIKWSKVVDTTDISSNQQAIIFGIENWNPAIRTYEDSNLPINRSLAKSFKSQRATLGKH